LGGAQITARDFDIYVENVCWSIVAIGFNNKIIVIIVFNYYCYSKAFWLSIKERKNVISRNNVFENEKEKIGQLMWPSHAKKNLLIYL